MRIIALTLLLLPSMADAWELRVPGRRGSGAFVTAQIVEIIGTIGAAYVKLEGVDPAVGCRLDAGVPADAPNGFGALPGEGFILLQSVANTERMLPVALFAKAHNIPVQILVLSGDVCSVRMVRTCPNPGGCGVAPPGI